MKLKYSFLFLVLPLITSPIFRLPKWLFNPLVIRLTNLPWLNPPSAKHKSQEFSSNSCGSTLTEADTIFESPGFEKLSQIGSCQSKIQINSNICNLRVKLKKFKLSGSSEEGSKCTGDKFWISSDLSHGDGVRHGESGVICGVRPDTEIHVPVSQTRTVYLNFKLRKIPHSFNQPAWKIEVIHQRCQDNLIRKYGLLDSVDECSNRRESRKNAKETFRRMKKYLFSRRQGSRQTRSILDWVFNNKQEKQKVAIDLNDENHEEHTEDKVSKRRGGFDKSPNRNTIISVSNMNNVPSDFFTIATSSNMELSRFSKQNSVRQTAKNASLNKSAISRRTRGNAKRRKSLFNKSSKKGGSTPVGICPVFLYSDSHGLTCMCKA